MNSVTLYPALYFTLIAACLKEPGSLVMMLTSALIFRGKEMPRQTGENYESSMYWSTGPLIFILNKIFTGYVNICI